MNETLLADADVFLHLGDHFRVGNANFNAAGVLLVIAVAAGVVGSAWLLKHWTQQRDATSYHNPRRLWRDLCRVQGITWSEARLLRRVSQQLHLEDPCQLFVDPAPLSASLTEATFRRDARRLFDLHERLFGSER